MRVISQDKTIDLNYDDIALYVDHEDGLFKVNALLKNSTKDGARFILAVYDSKEEAIDAISGVSKMYSRCLLFEEPRNDEAALIHHDTIDALIPDRKFKISQIQRIENSVYCFPPLKRDNNDS